MRKTLHQKALLSFYDEKMLNKNVTLDLCCIDWIHYCGIQFFTGLLPYSYSAWHGVWYDDSEYWLFKAYWK